DAKLETSLAETAELSEKAVNGNSTTPPESPKLQSSTSVNESTTTEAAITKSESTILNENPSLALPIISSPILPRADFEPVAAAVLPSSSEKESTEDAS